MRGVVVARRNGQIPAVVTVPASQQIIQNKRRAELPGEPEHFRKIFKIL
jgi:hypothetical protein